MIKTMTDKGCENLAHAIVSQALADYLLIREREYEAAKLDDEEREEKLKKINEDKWCNKNEIRQFLESQWFYALSGINVSVDKIFERLDRQHEKLMKEKEERELEKLKKKKA